MEYTQIDNQLFWLLDKPVPLTMDTKMPCLAAFSTEGTVGEYNRKALGSLTISSQFVVDRIKKIDSQLYAYNNVEGNIDQYILLQVIGHSVAEGSAHWALYQMMQGKRVTHKHLSEKYLHMQEGEDDIVFDDCNGFFDSADEFVKLAPKNGWGIYEEPKGLVEGLLEQIEGES